MTKLGWTAMGALLLTAAFGMNAAAATTGIAMDGKTYVIHGDRSTFEADGKTFIIGEDSVRIVEAGKPDRVLEMQTDSGLSESVVLAEDAAAVSGTMASEVTITAGEAGKVVPVEGSISGRHSVIYIETPEAVRANKASASITFSAIEQREQFSRYARFGLSHDAEQGILYYQGQRVRVFEDAYAPDGNSCAVTEYFDAQGTVDVEAQRNLTATGPSDGSYDPSGTLTGLRALSAEEFAARDLKKWTQPRVSAAYASSESSMSDEEAQALYAPYARFGLTYDAKADALLYQGQLVRRFVDVRQSNGEPLEGGNFAGSMTSRYNEAGTIDVTTVRDYATPDAEGNGKLIGMRTEP